jgi:hypothetical protein
MDANNLNEIMKQDPSLQGGNFAKVFERKCPVEMKIVEMSILQMVGQEVSSQENLSFKLMVKQVADKSSNNSSQPDIIRLELMSDNDFFFQYVFECDLYMFSQLKQSLNLKCDFNGFQTMLLKLITNSISDQEHFRCVLIMNSDATATITFF